MNCTPFLSTSISYLSNKWGGAVQSRNLADGVLNVQTAKIPIPNYFAFVYKKEKLIVLESFEAGNAYFCIKYDKSFEDVVNNISTFSKTEIFEYSHMPKRGYHVQNKFTLENNIRWYFRKGIQK